MKSRRPLLVIESEPLFRHALRGVFDRWGLRAEVVASWDEAEARYPRGSPEAVLLDLASEPASERRGLHNLVRERFPRSRTLVLAGGDAGLMAVYIKDGATAVVPRRELKAGQLRRMLQLAVPGRWRRGKRNKPPLSCNELRLLGWIGAGFDDATIANVLEVRTGVVRASVSRLRRKFRSETRKELMDVARSAGLALTPR